MLTSASLWSAQCSCYCPGWWVEFLSGHVNLSDNLNQFAWNACMQAIPVTFEGYSHFRVNFNNHDMCASCKVREGIQTCTRTHNCLFRARWDDYVWDWYEHNQAHAEAKCRKCQEHCGACSMFSFFRRFSCCSPWRRGVGRSEKIRHRNRGCDRTQVQEVLEVSGWRSGVCKAITSFVEEWTQCEEKESQDQLFLQAKWQQETESGLTGLGSPRPVYGTAGSGTEILTFPIHTVMGFFVGWRPNISRFI